MSDLFIPKKIKVGYQNREGTYTGRLAYVIYYDNKGVLRKEKSWEGWRDSKIVPEEFNNEPQDGFCLNKDVKRFNWSHFGSNRSYIRMYDPRGIEMEITPENLIGILTETDCLKRGLQGKFVYAWKGTELVLLPCGSEEYQKAIVHTERQDQNIPAKDLKPGGSYTTKKGEEVIYLGRFPWFEWNYRYKDIPRKSTKQHIFIDPKKPNSKYGNRFLKKSDVKFLAVLNSPDAVLNYAELIDEWNKDVRSSGIEKWEFSPIKTSMEEVFAIQNGYPHIKSNGFIERSGDIIKFWSVQAQYSYVVGQNQKAHELEYYIHVSGRLDTATMIYSEAPYLYDRSKNVSSKEEIFARIEKSVKAKVVLSNGKKINVTSIDDIASY